MWYLLSYSRKDGRRYGGFDHNYREYGSAQKIYEHLKKAMKDGKIKEGCDISLFKLQYFANNKMDLMVILSQIKEESIKEREQHASRKR
jgi:hypothetical protein